jgi:hypothetical protein
MDYRKAYLRRSMKQARLQKRLTIATVLAAAGCAAFVLRPQVQSTGQEAALPAIVGAAAQSAPALWRAAADASPAPAPARRIYPYSIVPGGVTSRADLAHAVMADKVVAAHYAGFAVDKASLRTVPKARAVYVSYRKGEQVYWTARKVTLAEGESILSDGQNDIRARCGNRISDTPQLPVEVKGPDEKELDSFTESVAQAGDGALREVAFEPDAQDGESRPFVASAVPNGAGLLVAGQAYAAPFQSAQFQWGQGQTGFGIDQTSLRSLLAASGTQDLRAGLRSLASGLVSSTAEGSAADGGAGTTGVSNPNGTGGSGSASAGTGTGTDAGRIMTASLSSTRTSDTAMSGSGSNTGAEPAGAGTANPPAPSLRTDAPPKGTAPAKTHELPEPGSPWLAGVAAAALLLQRRLKQR